MMRFSSVQLGMWRATQGMLHREAGCVGSDEDEEEEEEDEDDDDDEPSSSGTSTTRLASPGAASKHFVRSQIRRVESSEIVASCAGTDGFQIEKLSSPRWPLRERARLGRRYVDSPI